MKRTRKLPDLPPLHAVQQMKKYLHDDNATENALKLLKDHPGLARTDKGWYEAFPDQDPIICEAVEEGRPAVMEALLDAGSDPNIEPTNKGFADLLHMAINKSVYDDNILTCAEILARRPGIRLCYDLPPSEIYSHAELAEGLFAYSPSEESLERRKALFSYLCDHIPPEATRAGQDLFYPVMWNAITSRYTSGENLNILAQLLVNAGYDPNPQWTEEDPGTHVVAEAQLFRGNDNAAETIAGMMAAGMRKDCLIGPMDYKKRKTASKPVTLGEHLVNLSKGSGGEKACCRHIHKRLREILDGEIARVADGTVSPEQLLFTAKGGVSSQAQGLAANGRLDEVFDKKYAERFGGRDQQREFAFRMHDMLPEVLRGYFSPVGMLRDDELARPENTAVVSYVHGHSPAAGKGAA